MTQISLPFYKVHLFLAYLPFIEDELRLENSIKSQRGDHVILSEAFPKQAFVLDRMGSETSHDRREGGKTLERLKQLRTD